MPLEHYDISEIKHTFHDTISGDKIPSRVLFVLSTSDRKTVRQQRQKQIERIKAELEQLRTRVAAGTRSTSVEAVKKRVDRIYKDKDAQKYFTYAMVPLTKEEELELPAPKKGCRKPTHRFEYTFDKKLKEQDEDLDGYSAIVATQPKEEVSTEEVFRSYREQIYSEQVNSNVKGSIAIRPVWLKSPKRVEALLHLLLIALQLYLLIQREYRASVPEAAPEEEKRTTSRTLLQEFQTYTLVIEEHDDGRFIRPTRLTQRQAEILRRLGLPTPAETLRRLLPRPPS